MGTSGSSKHNAILPHDVMHNIFSKLKFEDKISSGLVCKQWDHLLKAGAAAGRHWVVCYNLNRAVSKRPSTTLNKGYDADIMNSADVRYANVFAVHPQEARQPTVGATVRTSCYMPGLVSIPHVYFFYV
jgi:hypothetical protein